MMSLMIEEMQHQARISLVGRDPFNVVIAEDEIKIGVGKLCRPVDDLAIQPESLRRQAIKIIKEQLIQTRRILQVSDLPQRIQTCRMGSKAFEPDGIPNEDVVQRSQDGTKKGALVSR